MLTVIKTAEKHALITVQQISALFFGGYVAECQIAWCLIMVFIIFY